MASGQPYKLYFTPNPTNPKKEDEDMSRPKSCTCEHYKAKEPHEYTCNMNINQHAKVKEPNNMRSLENATARPWSYTVKLISGNGHPIASTSINATGFGAYFPLEDKIILDRENKANAALIVRAVNSYDALVEALKILRKDFEMLQSGEWDTSTNEGRESAQASIDVINEAIAKAEGTA